MALNKTKLVDDLTEFLGGLDPNETAATKAFKLATIIDEFVKTGSIEVGSLLSSGPNRAGAFESENTTGGSIV